MDATAPEALGLARALPAQLRPSNLVPGRVAAATVAASKRAPQESPDSVEAAAPFLRGTVEQRFPRLPAASSVGTTIPLGAETETCTRRP